MTLELVDFSATASSDWPALAQALKANGKVGVGRYCVSDLSPNGRGIGSAEYAAYSAAGLEVFLFWEGQAQWMLGGYAAGVSAAQNAQANILAAGMPSTQPVIFAHDIDPDPSQWAAIDACFNGIASVVGWERAGGYGTLRALARKWSLRPTGPRLRRRRLADDYPAVLANVVRRSLLETQR
jgi:hypothetical protein